MIRIRPFEKEDWPAVWQIIEPVFRAGETYPFATDISEDEAYNVWVLMPAVTFVALDNHNHIAGTYYLKANQPALGAHVCNCGYIVDEKNRGKGIASAMCEHSQHEALTRGFLAMQFNLVVSTNETAIRVWKKNGLKIIGTLTKAFHHQRLGFVDALIMYKLL